MTRALKGYIMPETKFSFPFRMILAGSSGSGKTHFAGKLLKRNDLFEEKTRGALGNLMFLLRFSDQTLP